MLAAKKATVPSTRDGKAAVRKGEPEDLPFKTIFKAFGTKSLRYKLPYIFPLVFDIVKCVYNLKILQ
jgi:hypothetical protein